MKIIFATNNRHKLEEISCILGNRFEVLSLADIDCHDDIPEDADTLEENAMIKARYIWDHYHMNVFADDTGLEVDALGGRPGVHSARYAEGTDHDSEANMKKLLGELAENNNRNARFRTVIALLLGNDEENAPSAYEFEGIVNGTIAHERHGSEGFGYDPIFVPDGYDKSFAELGNEVKNTISHRARAVAKLAEFLANLK
ncbi:MAG: non-canonical purine NTP diphosphatase [Prevotella sp.]|nr:non-canonical purine NTP diphosphatase [Prevotella sp.]